MFYAVIFDDNSYRTVDQKGYDRIMRTREDEVWHILPPFATPELARAYAIAWRKAFNATYGF